MPERLDSAKKKKKNSGIPLLLLSLKNNLWLTVNCIYLYSTDSYSAVK